MWHFFVAGDSITFPRDYPFFPSNAGSHRALFPWNIHRGSRPENSRPRIRPPSWQLLEKRLEHHGLYCRRHGVSQKSNLVGRKTLGLLATLLLNCRKMNYLYLALLKFATCPQI